MTTNAFLQPRNHCCSFGTRWVLDSLLYSSPLKYHTSFKAGFEFAMCIDPTSHAIVSLPLNQSYGVMKTNALTNDMPVYSSDHFL